MINNMSLKNKNTIKDLINTVSDLKLDDYSPKNNDSMPDPGHLWKKIASFDTKPIDSTEANCSLEKLIEWFTRSIDHLFSDRSLLLSFGGYDDVTWKNVVSISADIVSFAYLWLNSSSQELLVWCPQLKIVKGIICEEHDYQLFKVKL